MVKVQCTLMINPTETISIQTPVQALNKKISPEGGPQKKLENQKLLGELATITVGAIITQEAS